MRNKLILSLPVLLLYLYSSCWGQIYMPNPAVVYCESLGYDCSVIMMQDGSMENVCLLPDSSIVDVWDFYKGKTKTEFSYCALKGYNTVCRIIEEGTYITECAYCQSSGSNRITILIDGAEEDVFEAPMIEIMENNNDIHFNDADTFFIQNDYLNPMEFDESDFLMPDRYQLPDSFDLRNVDGHSYIGEIQSQGGCGACYAFGAAATAEGVYNFATGSYDEKRKTFSESFIAWCLGYLPEYHSHFYGCVGADKSRKEIESLTQYGVVERCHFPYQTYAPSECSHWDDSKAIFSGWHRIDCNNVDAIKTVILNFGVVYATVLVSNKFQNYSGNIYKDNKITCDSMPCYNSRVNHAVALIGWGRDPVKGEYWILRNSWGSGWGEGGYMRIAMTSAHVACGVTYLMPHPVVYEADTIIETVVIKNGKNVDFRGYNQITLSDGFYAEEGARFYAYIQSPNSLKVSSVESNDNIIVPNVDSIGWKDKGTNINDTEIMVFPNPANQVLRVVNSEIDNPLIFVELFDLRGNRILSNNKPTNTLSFNIDNLPTGVYVLKIHTRKSVTTRKIIIN